MELHISRLPCPHNRSWFTAIPLNTDVRNQKFVLDDHSSEIKGIISNEKFIHLSIKPRCKSDKYINLLNQFPDLLRLSFKRDKPTRTIVYRIMTEGPSVFARSRCLDPSRLALSKNEFNRMIKLAITLPKKNSSVFKSCGDYKAHNSRTIPDRYPIPQLHDYS